MHPLLRTHIRQRRRPILLQVPERKRKAPRQPPGARIVYDEEFRLSQRTLRMMLRRGFVGGALRQAEYLAETDPDYFGALLEALQKEFEARRLAGEPL